MSTNIYQDRLKNKKNPRSEELHNLLNSRTTALAKKGEVVASTPDEEGYFDAANKTLMEGAGGRPLRGWQLALKGFYEGASTGKNKKKIEELNKIAQGLSYIEEQGRKASDMIMKKQDMKEAEEAIVPSLKTYLQKADSLSPRDRMDFVGGVVKQYNTMTGQDFAIDAVDGVNPANITLSSKKMGVQNIDLLNSPLFKGLKENIEQERLTRQADDYSKRQLDNETMAAEARARSADASVQRANLDEAYRPQELGIRKQEANNASERTKEIGAKRIQRTREFYEPKLQSTTNVINTATKLKELVKARPDMLNDLANVLYTAKHERSDIGEALNLYARQHVGDEQLKEYIATFDKLSAELRIGQVKGLSNPNMLIDSIVAQTVPGKGIPPKAYDKLITDMIDKAQFEKSIYVDTLNATKNIVGQEEKLGDFYQEKIDPYTEKVKQEAEEYYGNKGILTSEKHLTREQINSLTDEQKRERLAFIQSLKANKK